MKQRRALPNLSQIDLEVAAGSGVLNASLCVFTCYEHFSFIITCARVQYRFTLMCIALIIALKSMEVTCSY